MSAERIDLAELRRLHEAATPGPWEQSIAGIEGDNYVAGTGPWHRVTFNESASMYDATLIAAARNALPALLAVVEAALELRAATNSSMRNTGRQTHKERGAKIARLLAAEEAYRAALAPFKEPANG